MRRLLLAAAFASVGCAAPQLAQKPVVVEDEEAVVRGQGPMVVEPAPWGPSYLAPGELSCDTPAPPFGLGYEMGPPIGAFSQPPLLVPRNGPVPGAPAPKPPQPAAMTAEPGWFDVLPPEGGPISDDFGLPSQPAIENRIPNPMYVRAGDPDIAWETVAREASRYFPIRSEERVRQTGSMLTEGRLETQWASGSTIFEPWRRDSAGAFNRWQSTLQTIRRRAVIRVIPAAGGYELDVRVDKQLEDLSRPERASAGAASLRNDAALSADTGAVDPIIGSDRWIDIGRDEALEQRMLGRLAGQFGAGR
ncbi:hypothetical protein [Botrimarina mediterranea]|uniref:Outer membrane protein assembly factor BamC n=1 Tax=Botrimarina mediterranea TaxID=2528022 RepID=A0A518KE07_9BACT|nr:hypothetical protein [Botrimarina mediterranea]QDV76027.1 hypothetical protein Spa11_42510 [Botrimarina mediterranea]QDV80622.1 hypothetical protein K2D_42520 [Planctomycetes bacterium K2D]